MEYITENIIFRFTLLSSPIGWQHALTRPIFFPYTGEDRVTFKKSTN